MHQERSHMQSSKNKVYELLDRRTRDSVISDESLFQASSVASELFVSRTLASQYLNALHADGLLVKVSGRPTLFYSKKALEQRYQVEFQSDDFLSVQELINWISSHSRMKYDFEDVIGARTTLRHVIAQIKAAACYPPRGLPLLLVGSVGSGRSGIRKATEKWCVSERIIEGGMPGFTLDAASYEEPSQLLVTLFGKKESDEGMLAKHPHSLFWVINSQAIDSATWSALLSYFGNGHEKEPSAVPQSRSRLFFEYTSTPDEVMSHAWAKQIPMIAYMPSFVDRSLEDREALAVKAFNKESNKIGKRVLVSSIVLHKLASKTYEDGLVGLELDATIACANALADKGESGQALKIYSIHAPSLFDGKASYENMPEEPVLVDVARYDLVSKGSEGFSLLTNVVNDVENNGVTDSSALSQETFAHLSAYFEYLMRNRKHLLAGSSVGDAAGKVINGSFERLGCYVPVSFGAHLSNSMLFFKSNQLAASEWQGRMGRSLRDARLIVGQRLIDETQVMSHVANDLHDYLGLKLDANSLMIGTLFLRACSLRMSAKCRGIIAAHGYSTASSIADSANALLKSHVFDAIDMPLDISANQVADKLKEHLSRFPGKPDLVVLVDMGSLKDIGRCLSETLKVNVGVLNGVSTPMALVAGEQILSNQPMADVLRETAEKSRDAVKYSISECPSVRACIVFTSENGIPAAARLADLFAKSLPRSIDVDLIPCDYMALACGDVIPELEGKDILFAFGVNNPNISGVEFVSLEEIVDADAARTAGINLRNYLTAGEVAILKQNLIKNFSLENLMKHLTILEPNSLMEAVSAAVDSLQENIGAHFSYRMTMRMYIHVGYLVERLVTKDIIEYRGADVFARDHPDFVKAVVSSFKNISIAYGVKMPAEEINYLYDLINIDCGSKI